MMFSYDVAMVTKKENPQGAKTRPVCKRSSNLANNSFKMKGVELFCSPIMSLGDKPQKA